MKRTNTTTKPIINLKKYLSRRQIRKIIRFLDWCERTFTVDNILGFIVSSVMMTGFFALLIYTWFFAPAWMI